MELLLLGDLTFRCSVQAESATIKLPKQKLLSDCEVLWVPNTLCKFRACSILLTPTRQVRGRSEKIRNSQSHEHPEGYDWDRGERAQPPFLRRILGGGQGYRISRSRPACVQ